MASFKALNIESDDELDDEPDDTKEIQIEDALKIYQTALKYHSQGSKYLKEAGKAYTTLFESEIFKFPESQSEFQREEAFEKIQAIDGITLGEIEFVTATPTSNAENASNALPQILHLSYKNRGQYQLDLLETKLNEDDVNESGDGVKTETKSDQIRVAASKAIDDFAEALDKDEEDLDLWRRAAKLGQSLRSERVSRFCFEGVLDEDEDSSEDILGIPAIEKALTQQDLRRLTNNINDALSLSQIPDPSEVPTVWKHQLQMYPFLPTIDNAAWKTRLHEQNGSSTETSIVTVTDCTWNGVGQVILQRLRAEQAGIIASEPTTTLELLLLNGSKGKQGSPGQSVVRVNHSKNYTIQCNGNRSTPEVESLKDKSKEQTAARSGVLDGDAATGTEHAAESAAREFLPEPSVLQDGVGSGPELEKTASSTRKRSADAADLPENAEGGRGRSKRIRARASILDELQPAEGKALEAMSDYEWKINQSMFADGGLSDVLADITRRLGILDIPGAKESRNVVSQRNLISTTQDDVVPLQLSQAMLDFYGEMQKWNDAAAGVLLRSSDVHQTSENNPKTDLLAFLEHTNPRENVPSDSDFHLDIDEWTRQANEAEGTTNEVAMKFIFALLKSSCPSNADERHQIWPDLLKQTLIQLSIDMHDYMIERLFQDRYSDPNDLVTMDSREYSDKNLGVIEFVQSLFELHLDVYTRIINPASLVDDATRLLQKLRLDTWCNVAREFINDYTSEEISEAENARLDALQVRHLWTSIFYLAVSDGAEREHLIACLSELKREMGLRGNPVIYLPNNAVLPQLSIEAADREISKLKTKDFFSSVSQKEGKAPVDLIEGLEPLLEETIKDPVRQDEKLPQKDDVEAQISDTPSEAPETTIKSSSQTDLQSSTQNFLSQYLKEANVSLRMLLWQRLGEAYETIDYPSKVISVWLRSIQLLMDELKTPAYTQKGKEDREMYVLDSIRECGGFVFKILSLIEKTTNAFECMDDGHIKASIKAVLDLWTVLYAVALFDDYSQAGQKGGSLMNPFRYYPLENFHGASIKLHDMQIQCSILLYKLLAEAMAQMPDKFPNATEDKLQYLRNVHWFFGVRRLCKASDSQLLRFTKDELLKLPQLTRQSSDDLAQVLYDLYDLHCFSTPLERLEHGCDADYLDKNTALQLIDFVMEKVKRTNIKELSKSDLGKTIDKIHAALGPVKNTSFLGTRNRKIFSSYLKSPIRPLDLFRCLGGVGELSALPGSSDDAIIAASGWYFLKGQLSLAKFRSQRSKLVQASEEDIHSAIAFFLQDLEYNPEYWESWFRMAQAYDALLEEHVLWSAEKLNNHQGELCQTQRAAIHAYALAVAYMLKSANVSDNQTTTLAELYADFGIRIYASSCQPFGMRVFSTKDFPEKHYSDQNAVGGKYTMRPFKSLRSLGAMKLAGALLKKAIQYDSQNWFYHYMLAKCLWKIYQRAERGTTSDLIPAIEKALLTAVETLPLPKGQNRQEPILEPIYKTVSLAHKMVKCGAIDFEIGARMIETCLQRQKQFDVSKIPQPLDFDRWELYVLEVLKILRAADKSRWHHRVVFRAARILSGLGNGGPEGALQAKEYLIEQHLYSAKTLALTVWKPEHQRPGRHFWYMKQYAMFMAQIFDQTNDLDSIQILARRLRKKPNEYYEHTDLWEKTCDLHLKVHRRYGNIPVGLCDIVFKNIDQEEFGARASLIDTWTSSPQTQHPLQDVLRETAELKKLNAGLMKLAPIDDLLGDAYAAIWSEIGPTLEQPKQGPSKPASLPVVPVVSSPPVADRRSVMSLTNLMNLDGAADQRPTPVPTPTPTLAPTPTSLLPAFDLTTKPRARLISRREILKRASDTVISKVSAPPKAATPPPSKPMPRPSDPNIRVVIDVRTTGASTEDVAHGLEEAVNGSGVNSAPGSVHDDADDESELSELDEEEEESTVVVRPSIFPNLKRTGSGREDEEDDEEQGAVEDGDRGSAGMDGGGGGSGGEDSDVPMEELEGR